MNIIKFEHLDDSTSATTHEGEFIDNFEFNQGNYLVTRRIDPYSELHDRLEVTEFVQDWYTNGICISYGNASTTNICAYLEDIFNKPKLKEKIKIGWLPFDILDAMGLTVDKSTIKTSFSEEDANHYIGLIPNEKFNNMKDTLERVGEQSLYQLQSQIDSLTHGEKTKNRHL